jgi:4-amino-4-deoxy-L-arabinose transferase-like glycosyltransferase
MKSAPEGFDMGNATVISSQVRGDSPASGSLARISPELWLVLLWAALFLLAVTGYPNLMDNERRVAAYALDVMQNGHWIAQHDSIGDFMSKPPGLTWLVVLFSRCTGGLTLFSLYAPTALATLGVALVMFRAGRRHFGERAGFLAALMYLLSYVTDKQLTSARYDGLFALPVLIGALAAYRGWREGKGWFTFWVAMAVGGMVKGPLVFLLALAGLLALLLERDTGQLFRWRWQHAAGIAAFLIICGAWLVPIWIGHRDEFINKMIRQELVTQAVSDYGKYVPGQRFWEAPLSTLIDFLPWTPLGVLALVKALRRAARNDGRSFERFLACWFVGALLMFAIAAHQRGRLTWPIIPALALLSGRELDLWLQRFPERLVYRWAAGISIVVIAASALSHHFLLRYSRKCQETLALRDLAFLLRDKLGDKPDVAYVDAPFSVQFYLGYLRFNAHAKEAAALLNSPKATYVVASHRATPQIVGPVTNEVFHLYRWPARGEPRIELLSNRPALTK